MRPPLGKAPPGDLERALRFKRCPHPMPGAEGARTLPLPGQSDFLWPSLSSLECSQLPRQDLCFYSGVCLECFHLKRPFKGSLAWDPSSSFFLGVLEEPEFAHLPAVFPHSTLPPMETRTGLIHLSPQLSTQGREGSVEACGCGMNRSPPPKSGTSLAGRHLHVLLFPRA